MAGSSAVLEDGSLLSRIDRGLLRVETVFAMISGIAVFMLMVLAVWSVGGRKFFASPLPGYVDWIEFAMPLIAIMGISYTQRNGGHVRMDILIGQRPLGRRDVLGHRHPNFNAGFDLGIMGAFSTQL